MRSTAIFAAAIAAALSTGCGDTGYPPALQAPADGWTDLVRGDSLEGWEVLGSQTWTNNNGVIECRAEGGDMGWLVTEETYGNFILKMQFRWLGGNSGVQLRSRLEDGKMIGYQCNLDFGRPTATGTLLEENGRGLLGESAVKADDLVDRKGWNEYVIVAVEDHIVLYVNGQKTADVTDPEGADEGVIALQLAPGENAGLDWKDIRILEIP